MIAGLLDDEGRVRPEAGLGKYFRQSDAATLGISYAQLQRLVAEQQVQKLGRGQYRIANAEIDEYETLAQVAAKVPGGVVCLLTALLYHDIGTQSPSRVWLAIDRKARVPAPFGPRLEIVRFSDQMMTYGVKRVWLGGNWVRITSPARTIVDCFRYRFKIGLDAPMEALRDALRSRRVTPSELLRTAEVCRARTVIRPYIEALAE